MLLKKTCAFVFAMVLLFSFSTSSFAASTVNCSDPEVGVACQGVTMVWGDKVASSLLLDVPAGATIYYGLSTTSNSMYQMGALVEQYVNGKLVEVPDTLILAAGEGGTNGDYFTISSAGRYRVKLRSGDSLHGRSEGYAYIQYYYEPQK